MAEDFEDSRSQYQGDVIVSRPPPAPSIHRTSYMSSTSSLTDLIGHQRNTQYGMPPSTSSTDPKIKGGNSHTNHHHHHHHGNHSHHGSKRHHRNGKVNKDYKGVDRFNRTATVLRQAGLMKLTIQIAQLIKTNEDLQKEIDELQREAVQFSESLKQQLQQKLETNGNSDQLQQEKNY